MSRSRVRTLALALVLGLALPAMAARAEIAGPAPSQPAHLAPDQPVKAECWQQGVKIMDQTGLWGVNLGSLLRDSSVLLQSRPEGAPDVYILAVGQATCVVRRQ